MTETPAGWYPDGSGSQRYWDGARWTDHIAPKQPLAAPVAAPPGVVVSPKTQISISTQPATSGLSAAARLIAVASALLLSLSVVWSLLGFIRFGRVWAYIGSGRPDLVVAYLTAFAALLAACTLAAATAFVRGRRNQLVLLSLALAAWVLSLASFLLLGARAAASAGYNYDFVINLRSLLGLYGPSFYENDFHPILSWLASLGYTIAGVALVGALITVAVRKPPEVQAQATQSPAVAASTPMTAGWYPQTGGGSAYWNGARWVESPGQVDAPNQVGIAYPQISGLAVGALIAVFVIPILGLVLGYIASRDIDQSGGRRTGRGLATAAIVLGWVFTAITVVGIIIVVIAIASTSTSPG